MPKHLEEPLATRDDLWNFRTDLGADLVSIKSSFDEVSALYKKWNTAEWLKDEKTQDLEKWPEILGVFCRTYSDSLVANMALASMANKQLLDQRLEEASSSNPIYEQHRHDFNKIKDLLVNLKALVLALPEVWDDGNNLMRQFLKKVRPVAQDRGLFVHLGTDKYLYAATGRKGIQSDSWKNLKIGYGGRGHRFSITVPKEDAGSLKPQYHFFFCQYWTASDNGDVEHGRVKPAPIEISGQGMITGDKFSDVWALPSPRGEGASFVYAAHDGGTAAGSVKLLEMDARDQSTDGNWWPATKSGVVNVRAITHPPSTLPDDPDKDGLPPGSLLVGGVNHYNSIVYGALRSSSEIYVDQSNTRCYVPSPWGPTAASMLIRTTYGSSDRRDWRVLRMPR